jgi:hypothetical protein
VANDKKRPNFDKIAWGMLDLLVLRDRHLVHSVGIAWDGKSPRIVISCMPSLNKRVAKHAETINGLKNLGWKRISDDYTQWEWVFDEKDRVQ